MDLCVVTGDDEGAGTGTGGKKGEENLGEVGVQDDDPVETPPPGDDNG